MGRGTGPSFLMKTSILNFLIYVGYWTVVLGALSWFVHFTWPWGIFIIPMGAANIWLRRKEERNRETSR